MSTRKIKLKPIGECYVLSFLFKLTENDGNIEEAYKSMQDEFCEQPYFLPKDWWENTIQTSNFPNNYEDKKFIIVKGFYLPKAFIEYVE